MFFCWGATDLVPGARKLTLLALWCRNISSLVTFPTDASTYAHFLFNAFDTDHNGNVSFEVRRC